MLTLLLCAQFATLDADKHLDVLHDGRLVARYMYAHDSSTPERLLETYKPYLHLYDAEGKSPITKGPGGQFTHHRGIFIGWNRIERGGKSYDRWHMKGGEQVHQAFTDNKTNASSAAFTSRIHWNDEAGKPLLVEQRATAVRVAPAPFYALVDFASTLSAEGSDLTLGGDPEHAGVHFRPANEVVARDTTYVFPREGADPTKDTDYPWVGATVTIGPKRYSIVHMNHPDNPKPTKYSAYRDYGRFGAFFTRELKVGAPLTVRYRFLAAEGPMPEAPIIQKSWDEFAGVQSPSHIPPLTVLGGGAKGGKTK